MACDSKQKCAHEKSQRPTIHCTLHTDHVAFAGHIMIHQYIKPYTHTSIFIVSQSVLRTFCVLYAPSTNVAIITIFVVACLFTSCHFIFMAVPLFMIICYGCGDGADVAGCCLPASHGLRRCRRPHLYLFS